jgi:hypothetical protein
MENLDDDKLLILYRIAQGKRRTLFSCYDYDDQVYALKCLLRANNSDSIAFLKSFFEEKGVHYKSSFVMSPYDYEERPIKDPPWEPFAWVSSSALAAGFPMILVPGLCCDASPT